MKEKQKDFLIGILLASIFWIIILLIFIINSISIDMCIVTGAQKIEYANPIIIPEEEPIVQKSYTGYEYLTIYRLMNDPEKYHEKKIQVPGKVAIFTSITDLVMKDEGGTQVLLQKEPDTSTKWEYETWYMIRGIFHNAPHPKYPNRIGWIEATEPVEIIQLSNY